MYKLIKDIKPYFYSLREIKNNFSLDIKIPSKWSYDFDNNNFNNVDVKKQDDNGEITLISLISTSDQEGFDSIFNCSKYIIKTNKEKEEKEKLFNQKVDELKQLFFKSSLEDLKKINFTEENEDGSRERDGYAGEGETVISEGK